MRIAVAAISVHGVGQARRIVAGLAHADLWVSSRHASLAPGAREFDTLKDFVATAWADYEGLVFVTALGAVVRCIAPLVGSKHADPAVVAVDDAGHFSISALSGHLGGANELAQAVAGVLHAQAVVTTASDVLGLPSVDILGREFGWRVEDPSTLTTVAAAVVNGEKVAFIQECGEPHWWKGPGPLPANVQVLPTVEDAWAEEGVKALLVVSDRSNEALRMDLGDEWRRAVVYRPRSLCLGMGFRAKASFEELLALARQGLAGASLSPRSVAVIASIELKREDPALAQLAAHFGARQAFYSAGELNARGAVSEPDPQVRAQTGAVAVAEPAALLAAGAEELLLRKVKTEAATLAIARKAW